MLLLAPTLMPGPAAAPSGAPPPDSLVVVVSADNPLIRMDRLRLQDLYLGRTSRFADGRQAEPIDQAPGSPDRATFYATYLGRTLAEVKAHWSRIIFTGRGEPPREVPDGVALRKLVARTPGAIGYLERRQLDVSVHAVEIQ